MVGGEPVGNDEASELVVESLNRYLDPLLALRVQVAGGLV